MTELVHRPDAADGWLDVFERDVLLTTGRSVSIRPARSSDVAELREFYATLSVHSSTSRFFGFRSPITDHELVATTVQEPSRHVALIAVEDTQVVAVADYFAIGTDEAETAVAVSDRHQHEGVGTLLVEDLASIA